MNPIYVIYRRKYIHTMQFGYIWEYITHATKWFFGFLPLHVIWLFYQTLMETIEDNVWTGVVFIIDLQNSEGIKLQNIRINGSSRQ